jgi:hypothetical protein
VSAALSVVPERAVPERAVPKWHEQFTAVILPAVEAVARKRFRGLPVVERKESAAEAIAGALVDNGRVTPADLAASRIDFREWLGRMQHRRRQIAEMLAAGFGTEEVTNHS